MDTMKNSVVVVVTYPLPLSDKTGNVPAYFSKTGLKTVVSPVQERCPKLYNVQKRYTEEEPNIAPT
ncbi:MAG TPA: hypothetical protein ENN36_04500 [Candidatus Bathyarchaeota archaeon]|nr:hypothetical protein [Candidatus Bathyarchaeota archaeon]